MHSTPYFFGYLPGHRAQARGEPHSVHASTYPRGILIVSCAGSIRDRRGGKTKIEQPRQENNIKSIANTR